MYVLVPCVCPALSPESLCTLHGTDKKPKPCSKLDHGKTDNFVITANCLLLDTEKDIKLKEEDFT